MSARGRRGSVRPRTGHPVASSPPRLCSGAPAPRKRRPSSGVGGPPGRRATARQKARSSTRHPACRGRNSRHGSGEPERGKSPSSNPSHRPPHGERDTEAKRSAAPRQKKPTTSGASTGAGRGRNDKSPNGRAGRRGSVLHNRTSHDSCDRCIGAGWRWGMYWKSAHDESIHRYSHGRSGPSLGHGGLRRTLREPMIRPPPQGSIWATASSQGAPAQAGQDAGAPNPNRVGQTAA